ncbi:MAG: hypothetical protein WC693_04040 [Patescibacteria group bacterium]|jgi:ribosomal protein S27AE
MEQSDKEKIIKALNDRVAGLPCPRCGNQQFNLVDGYVTQSLQKDFKSGMILGGPALPSVVVVCSRCGFMSQHALGALGLLPPLDDRK